MINFQNSTLKKNSLFALFFSFQLTLVYLAESALNNIQMHDDGGS